MFRHTLASASWVICIRRKQSPPVIVAPARAERSLPVECEGSELPGAPGPRSALLQSHRGECSHHLRHPLAAAVRARGLVLVELRHVHGLGEFLLAIEAEKRIVRHSASPAKS